MRDQEAPPPFRGPLRGLAELSELLGGESPGSRRFLRGLALGALVGAAIAGSRIWSKRRSEARNGPRREVTDRANDDASDTSAGATADRPPSEQAMDDRGA